jgi:membrane-associated protease RseP (regulator of RpoE activity)
MKMRNLLTLLAIVLLVSSTALAQRTPPAPSTPRPPAAPDAPTTFSFFFDGGSYLGIVPENINRENMSQYGLSAPRGVGISSVSQGSPAEKAGLRKGDVILQFDGEPVASTRKLLRLIGESAPDHTVRLTIMRNGSEQQVTATLGQREDGARAYRALIPGGRGAELLRPTPVPRGWSTAPEAFAYSFGNNRRIGITTTSLTKQLADYFGVSGGEGLLITSISENSPASRAGLRAGDVITEVNGEKIDDSSDLIRALNFKEEGEVTLTIIRDKSQRTIKVTPERRPTPTFNLSELAPAAMLSQIPQIELQIPDTRFLQVMPKFELPVMPKIELPAIPKLDIRTLPRIQNLPRIEQLQIAPGIL